MRITSRLMLMTVLSLAGSVAFSAEAASTKHTFVNIPEITGQKSVTMRMGDVLSAMTAYDEYATIDGVYKPGELMPKWGSEDFQEIDMIESQAQILEIQPSDRDAKRYS